MTQESKVKRFREIVNKMADLYEKKNNNYGDSFGKLYEDLGPLAGLVPLHNKLDRATSLVKGNKNNFESLEDTFKDLACYAIMNIIEMEAERQSMCHTPNSDDSNWTKIWKAGDAIQTITDSTKHPCEGCSFYTELSTKDYYVGDTPCQWCSKSPYQITCTDTVTAIGGSGNTVRITGEVTHE